MVGVKLGFVLRCYYLHYGRAFHENNFGKIYLVFFTALNNILITAVVLQLYLFRALRFRLSDG